MSIPVDASAPHSSDPEPPVEGLRPPVQDRSRRTLERITRAALELIAERGVAGASVQDIVDRAGSSVGSFYARFDGKDDLVRFLESRVWEDAAARWQEGVRSGAWESGTLEELIEGLVRLLARIEATDGAQRQAFGAGPGVRSGAAAAEFRGRIADDAARLILARRSAIAHAEPDRAARLLPRVLMGAVREVDALPGDEATVRELTRLGLSYLGAASGEAPDEQTTMDFFDVWG